MHTHAYTHTYIGAPTSSNLIHTCQYRVHTQVNTHSHRHTYTLTHNKAHTHTCIISVATSSNLNHTFLSRDTYMHIHTHTLTHARTHTHTHTHSHRHAQTQTCTHTCTHTHTHTHKKTQPTQSHQITVAYFISNSVLLLAACLWISNMSEMWPFVGLLLLLFFRWFPLMCVCVQTVIWINFLCDGWYHCLSQIYYTTVCHFRQCAHPLLPHFGSLKTNYLLLAHIQIQLNQQQSNYREGQKSNPR